MQLKGTSVKILALIPLILNFLLRVVNCHGKVLELSDRFLPLRHEGMWLMKFYAPWCGHCKKLEPIWKHVAQSLTDYPVRVGRIDCTRFSNVASEFNIRGFPTIMFLKGEETYTYEGDRSREDIVAFAHRVMGPPVKKIKSDYDLDKAKEKSDHFFLYIGNPETKLYEEFVMNAKHFQRDEFMYLSTQEVMNKHVEILQDPAIYVHKDNKFYLYADSNSELERGERETADVGESGNADAAVEKAPITIENSSMTNWITRERFPLFAKVTRGKFSQFMATKKLLAIAVLEENKIEKLTAEMEAFKDMLQKLVEQNQEKYGEHFQFGWTGLPDLANSIAMENLEIPSLLVINTTSFHHHLPDDEPSQLTPAAVELFLDSILSGEAPSYGGSSWMVRLYRAYYEVSVLS